MHPFTASGHGQAPFKFVSYELCLFRDAFGNTKAGTTCSHCGTAIAHVYWIESADAHKFKVGCDCVRKLGLESNIAGFREARLKVAREARKAKRDAKWAAIRAEREDRIKNEQPGRLAVFTAAHPQLTERLLAYNGANSFVADMRANLHRWGDLTDNQLRAVEATFKREDAQAHDVQNCRHVGKIGERYTDTFTVVRHSSSQGQIYPYPVSHWHLLRTQDGHLCTYRGSRMCGSEGETFKATFTVAEHTVYRETKQTVLQRPKFLEE